ncbi:hypothetical protein N7493_006581 [Penicillium malachiteum]|uniref:NACHT domain-containing protein n=1 Tax=Penicillium malachiteum TaxID=1324776 RepID=A0AAD6HLK3_9EURO|nr:hypothetical protein N7493_006581 [Penicillium malachiteum]
MTLHICALASQAQEDHASRLTQLQSESNKLQFDQSVKIDKIMVALDEFRRYIESVQRTPPESPTPKEIMSLEKYLSELSLSRENIEEELAILKSLNGNAPAAAAIFSEWLRRENGIFWVSGKPGSGKSTFMKFVADEPMTRTAMQKSQQGLLRTLLYEIFRQCSELIRPLCESMRSNLDKEEDLLQWSLSNLRVTLRKVACSDMVSVRLCFFIDGLDEYSGDHSELCQVLKDLANSPNIKICLSSRPWNVFEDAFGSDSRRKLYIQDLTRNDILEYVRCRLYEHPRWPMLATGASQADSLIHDIERRACGVFLWVFLVVKRLREGLTNRDSFLDIRRRLESFPEELESFFRQILESVEPFYHNKMSTTMQIAIAANEPLHVMAYDFHDQAYEDENYVFHVPIRPYSPEEEQELKEQTAWRLNSRSRGLLELNMQSGTVTFLHRTVVDFLRTQEMTTFLANQAPAGFNLMLSLLKIYTSMIKRTEFKEDVVRMKFGEYKNCYLQFLTTGALACAAELEESANRCTATYKVMEELDNTILERGQQMGYLSWKLPKESCYLSGLGPSLIPCILVPQGAHGRPSLDYAWQTRGIEMLRLVVETQEIDPNEQQFNMDPRRSWSAWTALIGHVTSWTRGTNPITEGQFWDLLENNILSTLLHKGADPNVMIWSSYNECWPAFAAYLDLAFEVPSDVTREALYLQVLKDFIFAGASMDASQSEFTNRSITQTLGKEMKIVSSSKKFFSRLENIHTADSMDCNFR